MHAPVPDAQKACENHDRIPDACLAHDEERQQAGILQARSCAGQCGQVRAAGFDRGPKEDLACDMNGYRRQRGIERVRAQACLAEDMGDIEADLRGRNLQQLQGAYRNRLLQADLRPVSPLLLRPGMNAGPLRRAIEHLSLLLRISGNPTVGEGRSNKMVLFCYAMICAIRAVGHTIPNASHYFRRRTAKCAS